MNEHLDNWIKEQQASVEAQRASELRAIVGVVEDSEDFEHADAILMEFIDYAIALKKSLKKAKAKADKDESSKNPK